MRKFVHLRFFLMLPFDKSEIAKQTAGSERLLARTDYILKIAGWTAAAAALNKYASDHNDKFLGILSFALAIGSMLLFYFWISSQISYPDRLTERAALTKFYIGQAICAVLTVGYGFGIIVLLRKMAIL